MPRRFALLALLLAVGSPAAELVLADSAMYGKTAVLSEGETRLELALSEGVRIVSWRFAGREIGFVGRIWGGDMYDRFQVDGQSGDTRFRTPAEVAILRQGNLVAVRARFALADGVVLQRILALGPAGLFLETEFAGTTTAWYEFAAHLIRRGDPGPGLFDPAAGEGSRRPLQPGESYADLSPNLALIGLDGPALIWHFGEGMRASPRVWGDNLSFGLAGTYRGAPLRVSCQWRGEEDLGTELPAAPAFPDWAGEWEAIPFAVPEPPRPALPDLAREHGPYGVCNARPAYMAPLAAAGLRWVRLGDFAWAVCESEPGGRDYSRVEVSLAAAEREGLAVIGEMSGNPGWATTDGSRLSPPRDWNAWERHVEQVVERFRDRVHVWEIWNEPDIRQFWTGTVEDYVQLLRHAHRAAKRADPACLVMSAGLDGSGEAYLARMLELGAGEYCDLIGAHPYAGPVAVAEFRLKTMRRILAFHGLDKPLWVTEVGWQSGGWKGGPGVVDSEETKAARLAEAYPRLAAHADVLCWYVGVEPGQMYGLLQPAGQAGFVLNPAWFAMRDLALPPAPGIRIEAPQSLRLTAGEAAELRAVVRSDRPVRARWLGLEPGWGNPGPVAIPANGEETVAVSLDLPAYLRPEERHLLLAVQDESGRHLANQAVSLQLENPGRVCDLHLTGDWIRRIDREGQEVGRWIPAHSLPTAPGEGFVQPVRPHNRGNFDDTLALTVEGTAAAWLDPVPATVAVVAEKSGWVGLRVRVPADAVPGTYTLAVRIQSRTFPEVQAEWRGAYSIVAAENP